MSRALDSLFSQHYQDWELVIVNDGSPDDTANVVRKYRDDARVRYFEWNRNRGIGEALNFATDNARGEYIAYLPSDDVYYPWHLADLVGLLDSAPNAYLAYGSVSHHDRYCGWSGPTLQGSRAVGNELAALRGELECADGLGLTNNNVLALVQVLHRRHLEKHVRWTTRSEYVSDYLEPDFWRSLIESGAVFKSLGRLTCEWSDHPDQHHKIIAEKINDRHPAAPVPWARAGRGLAAYRSYYGVPEREPINWIPSYRGGNNKIRDITEDQRTYSALLNTSVPHKGDDSLKILMVGSLSHNPERILALEEAGHELYGLWVPLPETWDPTSPEPYSNTVRIPYAIWKERVNDIRPDVIYALLDHQALPLIDEILSAELDIPAVFHFKESPSDAMRHGLWETLERVLRNCDAQMFISEENFEWFKIHFPEAVGIKPVKIMEGELPKIDWMTEDWAPRLSDIDGELHTVCVGRPIGLGFMEKCADLGIHVHFYGSEVDALAAAGGKGFQDQYGRKEGSGGRPKFHLQPPVHPPDWVKVLSQYDAAWCHVFESDNRGDLRGATWNDLNIPARFGTYMAAGLPLLVKDSADSITAVGNLTKKHDIGIHYQSEMDVLSALQDKAELNRKRERVIKIRHEFTFDAHVSSLVEFFREIIRRGRSASNAHTRG